MKQKERSEQKIMCITVCALLSLLPILDFVNSFCNKFVSEGFIYDSVFCYTAVFALIIKAFTAVAKNIKKDVIVFTFVLLAAWVITYSFFPQNRVYMMRSLTDVMGNPFYILFVYSFSGYVFSRYITDFEMLESVLAKFAVVVIIGSTVSFFMTLNKNYQKQYMVFSYNMLCHVVFLIMYYFERRNPVLLAVGILGFFTIVIAGCRGALICCILSIAIYFMFRKIDINKKVFTIALLAVMIYILTVHFNEVISLIADFAENLKIDSRTITQIKNGEFFEDSGRSVIKDRIVTKYNLLGYGLYGDRVLGGNYAHNFIVEIIAQFGYVFGVPILAAVFLIIVHGLFANDKHLRNLIIAFLSAGFFKLFFSSSYLNQEPAFYILLGLCINCFDYKRQLIMGEKQNVHTSENV